MCVFVVVVLDDVDEQVLVRAEPSRVKSNARCLFSSFVARRIAMAPSSVARPIDEPRRCPWQRARRLGSRCVRKWRRRAEATAAVGTRWRWRRRLSDVAAASVRAIDGGGVGSDVNERRRDSPRRRRRRLC